jgi:hypothetical protein
MVPLHEDQMKLAPVVFSACLAMTVSAFADSPQVPSAAVTPVVYDSANHLVGALLWQNEVSRKINGTYYWMNAVSDGLLKDAIFFYASTDCSGQAMIEDSTGWYLLPYAIFDGHSVWGPTPGSEVGLNYQSYSFDGSCTQDAGYSRAAAAQVIDSGKAAALVPPFIVK